LPCSSQIVCIHSLTGEITGYWYAPPLSSFEKTGTHDISQAEAKLVKSEDRSTWGCRVYGMTEDRSAKAQIAKLVIVKVCESLEKGSRNSVSYIITRCVGGPLGYGSLLVTAADPYDDHASG
jgi:hypothetical protein